MLVALARQAAAARLEPLIRALVWTAAVVPALEPQVEAPKRRRVTAASKRICRAGRKQQSQQRQDQRR
jgi:hypothetical protein